MELQREAMVGKRVWAILEGYIPTWSHGPEPGMQSHGSACILNPNDEDAHLTITLYFSDRHPLGPYHLTVPAQRTQHQRFNSLKDAAPVPRGTDFASVIRSDTPAVVQHTRLDTRQREAALMSTAVYAEQ